MKVEQQRVGKGRTTTPTETVYRNSPTYPFFGDLSKNRHTTNKTGYTVTNYLPINSTLTAYDNKKPPRNSTNHSTLPDYFIQIFKGVLPWENSKNTA